VRAAVTNNDSVDGAPPNRPPPVEARDHKLGADQAKLTLIEYGDFGCPFCFAAKRPVSSLLERYETLRLVWRHFPDPELHPGADLAAELSELATQRGRFWDAHDALLAGRGAFSRRDLLSVAVELGLDGAAVERSLAERTSRDRVLGDVRGGKSAGVHGTPTFFLDGERVECHWRELSRLVPAILAARDGTS
jgi:protein-disulfide isomerase